jgi:hypothetical protein
MDWGATAGKHGSTVDGLVAEQLLTYVREVFLKFGGLFSFDARAHHNDATA